MAIRKTTTARTSCTLEARYFFSIKTLFGKKYRTPLPGKNQKSPVLDQFFTTFVSVNNKVPYQRKTLLRILY